jgi:CheY-like chemotaxis protein
VSQLQTIPVIAVTAWPPDTGARMAKAYGFDGYISKPIEFSTLSEQVAAYLPTDDAQ